MRLTDKELREMYIQELRYEILGSHIAFFWFFLISFLALVFGQGYWKLLSLIILLDFLIVIRIKQVKKEIKDNLEVKK